MPYPNPKTTQRTSNKLISEYESQEMPRILGRNMTVSILDKDYLKFGILDTYYRLNNTGLFRFCSWFFFICSWFLLQFNIHEIPWEDNTQEKAHRYEILYVLQSMQSISHHV